MTDKKIPTAAEDYFDRTILQIAAGVMDDHPRYADADRAVNWVFTSAPRNGSLTEVLAKVSVLNSLYATSIYDVVRMAKHVASIKALDDLLQAGDASAVAAIRKGHGITAKHGSDRDFYSFATKYCHFHSPEHFPMWDTLVSELLYRWNRVFGWLDGITKNRMREYDTFTEIVIAAKKGLDSDRSFKRFDMGLWIVGKYLYGARFDAQDAWVDTEFVRRISECIIGYAKRTESLLNWQGTVEQQDLFA